MNITTDSYGSTIAALVLVFGAALAVLLLVHTLTAMQIPDSVPNCGSEEVLDAFTHQCVRVGH